VLAAWLTPRVRDAAVRFGIVDRPDGRLKQQREPVPYLGGLAIYLAFLLALSATFDFSHEVLGLLLGGSIVVILGQLTFLPFAVALPLSVLWLLAVTNAFNLIDIMDGLSAGTAVVAAVVLLVVADRGGEAMSATLLAALAGACLGFLRFNFEPARIYMGDAGSQFLGLSLGALAMNVAYTQHNALAALAPALILGVPLFDMMFVMYVRFRRGLPVMLGSPDHVALRLRKWRLSTRQTVLVSYAVTGLLGAAALALTVVPLATAGALLASLVVVALATGVWLRRIDMSL
jgi:UDP-GlcNAc:undecaprenyl-phosphate GlcNAc-1-phosphate transferase